MENANSVEVGRHLSGGGLIFGVVFFNDEVCEVIGHARDLPSDRVVARLNTLVTDPI